MSVTETLVDRNAGYDLTPGLRMMPALRVIVIGCVDPRVDPTAVLGLAPGDGAVIRNVGGRVTPDVLGQLALLRTVTQAAGGDLGPGWELIVLQHTDCGITRLLEDGGSLAAYLGVEVGRLGGCAVDEPRAAVARDVAVLRADARTNGARASGLVYDVATGRVEVVDPG